jgi:hypothetical protein
MSTTLPPSDGTTEARPMAAVEPSRWRLRLPGILLWAAVALCTVGWSALGWDEYRTFHLYVYDFGLIYQNIWALAHGLSPAAIGPGAVNPIVFAFAPVATLFPSEPTAFLFLLTVESFVLALGALPIYLLVAQRFGRRWTALALSLAYLGFPALSGLTWFPFHFQALFPTLFLFAYWLYRRDRWVPAAVLWTLSLLTNIGSPLVVGAFGAGLIIEPLVARLRLSDRWRHRPVRPPGPFPRTAVLRGAFLVASSAVVFGAIVLYFYWYWGIGTLGGFLLQEMPSGAPAFGSSGTPLEFLGRRFATVALLLGPLLLLPLWGREERWSTWPYFLHALAIGAPQAFIWPFRDQYVGYVIPGLFAATLRALDRPWGGPALAPGPSIGKRTPLRRMLRWRVPDPSPQRAASLVLVATAVAGSLFAAGGPLNPLLQHAGALSGGYYDIPVVTTIDPHVAAGLDALIAATPPNGNLLVQNNLVEPVNRFQYVIPGYYSTAQRLDFVLTDPYDDWFYAPNLFGPYPVPMWQWANYFLANGWSIAGEARGSVLLAHNASMGPRVYLPVWENFTAASLAGSGNATVTNVSRTSGYVVGPSLPTVGALAAWMPGTYRLNLTMAVDHPSPGGSVTLALSYDQGHRPLAHFPLGASGFSAVNGTVNVSFAWTFPLYFVGMQFNVSAENWTGGLKFVSLNLTQTAPIQMEHLSAPWSLPPPNGTANATSGGNGTGTSSSGGDTAGPTPAPPAANPNALPGPGAVSRRPD